MTLPADFKSQPLEFIDLGAQRRRIGKKMDDAIARVLDHGGYILGPEVAMLESQLAEFAGVKHCISCSNGTDAITLALLALSIGAGDGVLTPSFTFAATAETIALRGATPIFCEVRQTTFNLNPDSLAAGLAAAKKAGVTPRAVIAVDLFGQPCEYDAIEAFCEAEGLTLIVDAAQSFGARYHNRRAGAIGRMTTTSFFPAKPLGCYGDGGAVFTDDDELAKVLESLRVHGKGEHKYDNQRIGFNARLDTIQAAILIEKLAIFPEEVEARDRIASHYRQLLDVEPLQGIIAPPPVIKGAQSVWAQYTLRVPAARRASIMAGLKAEGVPTAIYYPRPLHRQTAYRDFPLAGGALPVSDGLSEEVLSLPMHPYLDEATQARIIELLTATVGEA